MVFRYGQMDQSMKECGKIICKMVMDFIQVQMVTNLKVNGKMVIPKVKVNWFKSCTQNNKMIKKNQLGQVGPSIVEISRMDWFLVKGLLYYRSRVHIKVTGKMARWTEKESKHFQMVDFSWEISNKEKW